MKPRPAKATPASEEFWSAVLKRDKRMDGRFVFAVRSTGIYCRPSCPARRPHRRHALFFSLPEAAEQAGFRPCRRCRPRQTPSRNPQAERIQRVCRYIESHAEDSLPLKALSRQAGISPHHFQRTFKRLIGLSPREYAEALRVTHLKKHLRHARDVTAALYEAGYGSSSRLYEKAHAQLGMTPATYRRGGKGMDIRFTIVSSPLDGLLVGATRLGICALYLGDDKSRLEKALREEYPHARIRRDRDGLARWVKTLLRHLEGKHPHLDLPLDVQATAFQRRVWQELQRIPYGTTRSYSEIAHALGKPSAVRAVARACATNPVSVIVPCHRVVRSDGNLAGYRWGLKRKKALLEKESAVAAGKADIKRSRPWRKRS